MSDRKIDKRKRQFLAGSVGPAALSVRGLVIIAGGQLNVHEGLRCHEPDKAATRAESAKISEAMNLVRAIAPDAGGHSSEMSYFSTDWQNSVWGDNDPRLLALKQKYDPTGLFLAHHYVCIEGRSRGGFEKHRVS